MKKWFFLTLIFFFWGSQTEAFFLTVIQAEKGNYGIKGEEISWFLFRSEPFQGLIFDLKAPEAWVFDPQKKRAPVSLIRTKMKDWASGKERYVLKARYLPDQEGDYYLVLITTPTLLPQVPEVWQEYVKVPFHVVREGDWAHPLGLPMEIVPSTRPYGLRAGFSFSGVLLLQGKPAAKVKIQLVPFFGHYLPPAQLPKDPQGLLDSASMYWTSLTNERGEFTLSLPRSGWWLITASVPMGFHTLGQERYPLFWRTSLWIYVNPPFRLPEKAPKLSYPGN